MGACCSKVEPEGEASHAKSTWHQMFQEIYGMDEADFIHMAVQHH